MMKKIAKIKRNNLKDTIMPYGKLIKLSFEWPHTWEKIELKKKNRTTTVPHENAAQ